jgi:hypothetical protein
MPKMVLSDIWIPEMMVLISASGTSILQVTELKWLVTTAQAAEEQEMVVRRCMSPMRITGVQTGARD